MWHKREASTIARLFEECKAGHESKHHSLRSRIRKSDDHQEHTSHQAERVDEHFLAPERARVTVNQIGDDTAGGAEHEVQQSEHCGPVPRSGLAKGREGVVVEGAEDGVDG